MMTPRPFTIHVPDEALADLQLRLERIRWPDENPAGGWQYGSDLAYMKTLAAYWREKYNQRVQSLRYASVWRYAPLHRLNLVEIVFPVSLVGSPVKPLTQTVRRGRGQRL